MALSSSGLVIPTWRDILDATQLGIDFDAETHRVAMFTNAVTNNLSTDTAYGTSPFNANEVSGTGYTAGGELLTGTTLTESPTGTLKWDANDVDWATSTITNARGAIAYADALANEILALWNFGSDYSTVAGLFRIQWHSNGLVTIDLTP
jgi:hypothetical protein